MFNEYMWQTYLNAGGKNVADMFENNLKNDFSEQYADDIFLLHKEYCPSKMLSDDVQDQLLELFTDLLYGVQIFKDGKYTINSAMKFFYKWLCDKEKLTAQKVFDIFSGSVPYYTTLIAIEISELFIPYYFQRNFNVFEKIAQEFEIELPPVPIKKDYEGRFYYYGEICSALLDFREKHNMSPYELYAFLYDFAPKYIGGTDSYIIKDLPEPKSAFFIGGSKDDIFLDDDFDIITPWQCNPDTRAGDMIVMYLRSPISAVDSVWRSVSVGFNDPFFYYYRCTYIAKPVGVKRITQKQLEQDEIFKDLPIVRKNMQGINGVELKPSEYNHIVDISDANVPKIKYTITNSGIELSDEKDVENKLIIPLLKKLEYQDDDFGQQIRIEIGNHNNMIIPDFLINFNNDKSQPKAFAVIEAKYTISGHSDLEAAKNQARSYARQVIAKYSIIASKDKIRVSSSDSDYTEEIFEHTWDELNNADVFSELFKLIGRKIKR